METNSHSLGPPSNEWTKAVVLVGGLGTRLRTVVPSRPKPLASIGTKSFLCLLIQQLRCQDIRHVVLCTGYLADQIENELGDGRDWGVTIDYSKEVSPLGTAGAIKLATPYLRDLPDFLVMNGDSFVEIDFHQLLQFHRAHGGLATLAVVEVEDTARYGTVLMDETGRISRFLEKTGKTASGKVSAGVYVFNRVVLERIPEGQASLESTVFPLLLDEGVFGFKQNGIFIDIGTPEDYARAQDLYSRLDRATRRTAQILQ